MEYTVTVPTRDHGQWLTQLRIMSAIADRTSRSLMERSRATLGEAGISIELSHNAMVSHERGQPWRGVNYSLVRRGRWLVERSYQPRRMVERWYSRTYWEAHPQAVSVSETV
jgi:hypothetical protein